MAKSDELQHLDSLLGPELEIKGGILDRLNYQHVRRLGVTLRNIPRPGKDWDLPPATLQGWVASYDATIDVIRLAQESRLLPLLKQNADQIRDSLSLAMIPTLDLKIADRKILEKLIKAAKSEDHLQTFDVERFLSDAPKREEIASVIIVQLDTSIRYVDRPRVDEEKGKTRLEICALLGQVAMGGRARGSEHSPGRCGRDHYLVSRHHR
jgi:hypothetical protein